MSSGGAPSTGEVAVGDALDGELEEVGEVYLAQVLLHHGLQHLHCCGTLRVSHHSHPLNPKLSAELIPLTRDRITTCTAA